GTVGGTRKTILNDLQIREVTRSPSKHISFHLIDCVPSCHGDQSADCIPTGSAVDFCCPSDVKRMPASSFINCPPPHNSTYSPAPNSEAFFLKKSLETPAEIIGGKGKVSVQLNKELPILCI